MKRAIFTLLYDRGQFMLSRNFRLQAVGSVNWLFDNYDFATVSRGLDELMLLDVSREKRDTDRFADIAATVAGRCFIPMTIGGGITSAEVAQKYMRSGADKLLINSAFRTDPELCASLAAHFGRQCIVAGIDYRKTASQRLVYTEKGSVQASAELSAWVDHVQRYGAGEILFQSIDSDGTGMGLDLHVVDGLPARPEVPCILMGGVGKPQHIIEGLLHRTVDAVATANLFNFIGNTFLVARKAMHDAGIDVPQWDGGEFAVLRNRLAVPA